MKLEYLDKGASDCPLIRIYGQESFNALIESFIGLAIGQIDFVIVEHLPNYESINDCHLVLSVAETNKGIIKTSGSNSDFSWIMARSSWEDLAGLAEPFKEFYGYGYQWLAGREVRMANLAASNIALVISSYPDGQW